jgi:uncharacterized protein (DUF1778 family)
MSLPEAKSEQIEVWATPAMKGLLQSAAASSHKSVAEFLLEAGLAAAETTLADGRVFRLDDEPWAAFQKALDRAVTAKPRLKKLLDGKGVLE